jgi:creatinine amidohydrolase
MPIHRLAEMTWEEVRELDRAHTVAILPVGAMEAHGPHLPLATDVIIAEAMGRACAEALAEEGRASLLLPALWATYAGFGADFPGTVDVASELARHGFAAMAIANAHLDPGHLASLRAACDPPPPDFPVVFVDLTRRASAERLTEEFRTGACHAGRFEGSVVLAEAPELVREHVAAELAPNPASLSVAIRDGARTFAEAGGARAYFGWPADATAEEGRDTVHALGRLLAEAVGEALG